MPPIDDDPLELTRAALADRRAWLVGGAVRDRLLGRRTGDLDVVLDGEPREAARALARTARAAAFALSEEYGGWRVVARDGAWQVDFERLRGTTLEEDLALRDFTVNAIAEPLGEPGTAPSGEAIDPLGGVEDLARRRLREAGPHAFADDPLRVLRLVRLAVELDLQADADTRASAQAHAAALGEVAPERVFMELRRILDAPRAVGGLELMGEVGATEVVLPELEALRGVTQSHYHHLDVYGHTLEVLEQVIALQADPAVVLGGGEDERRRDEVAALLAEPLADGLTRGGALRWGALLAALGPQLAGEVLGRLRASGRLRAHVAALVRNHLRLGFLVNEPQPLARRGVFAYLRGCEPVEVDITVLSIADRLAGRNGDAGRTGDARRRRVSPGFGRRRVSPGFGRGERAQEAIDAHLRLARELLVDALAWHAQGPPPPLLRGDELAGELGIPPGPRVGELLEELAAAQYAGEIATRKDALAYARAQAG